jgi:hypothetical protein
MLGKKLLSVKLFSNGFDIYKEMHCYIEFDTDINYLVLSLD